MTTASRSARSAPSWTWTAFAATWCALNPPQNPEKTPATVHCTLCAPSWTWTACALICFVLDPPHTADGPRRRCAAMPPTHSDASPSGTAAQAPLVRGTRPKPGLESLCSSSASCMQQLADRGACACAAGDKPRGEGNRRLRGPHPGGLYPKKKSVSSSCHPARGPARLLAGACGSPIRALHASAA